MRESDIKHENGRFWVGSVKNTYTVYEIKDCASYPDSSYEHNEDGLSIAIARCDYLAKKRG